MHRLRLLIVFALVLAAAPVCWSYFKDAPSVDAGHAITESAKSLVASFSPEQRAQAVMKYDAPERLGWHFIPKPTRKGLPLGEMSESQRGVAHLLLQGALSQVGYHKSTQIMELEKLLHEMEANRPNAPVRDPLRYYVTIFGDPASEGRWGLSFEGHHLSLNFVLEQGKVVDSTPQFLGTAPAKIMEDRAGFKKGTEILRDEEQLGFALVNQLTSDQQATAIIAPQAPGDVRSAGEAQPPTTAPEGLSAAEMTPAQQDALRAIIGVHAHPMPREIATARLAAINEAGLEKVHFAWAGALKPGIGHYYRVQGPTFLIEFVNSAPDAAGNPANHVHCIWRDMNGDFALPVK